MYHYCCDGTDDRGWGCVYRSIQNACLLSNRTVPTLAALRNAVTNPGSNWCEPAQFAYMSDTHTALYVASPDNTRCMLFTRPHEYDAHMQTVETLMEWAGSDPVVIDNGTYAYTMMDNVVFDPHTTRADNVRRSDAALTMLQRCGLWMCIKLQKRHTTA